MPALRTLRHLSVLKGQRIIPAHSCFTLRALRQHEHSHLGSSVSARPALALTRVSRCLLCVSLCIISPFDTPHAFRTKIFGYSLFTPLYYCSNLIMHRCRYRITGEVSFLRFRSGPTD
jgi:hypothetical protein